jgi:hypothetical protein
MATPQLTFNTAQTAILMADFHREGMGDNPIVRERGTVQKARTVLEAARQAGVLVVYLVVNFRRLCRKFCSGGCAGAVAPVRVGIMLRGSRTVRPP